MNTQQRSNLFSIASRPRTNSIIRQIRPYIEAGNKVIDIGAGSGSIAVAVSAKLGADITAIDTVDHNKSNIPFKIYDGKKLPYKDKTFDVALLIFVLHHADNIPNLIDEALRVSKRVIVIEDTPKLNIEKMVWKKFDYLVNHRIHSDINIAHESKSVGQWQKIFKAHKAVVSDIRKFRSFYTTFLLYPHTLFVIANR